MPSRAASRRATASAPSLLKPIRLTTARSAGSRNSRGRGLPGCGSPVTVPTSTKPNPSAASASIPSAFLSNPAARPSAPGKVSPIASTGRPRVGERPVRRNGLPSRRAPEAEPVGGLRVDAGQDAVEQRAVRRHARPVRSAHSCSDRTPMSPRPHRLDALHRGAEPLHGGDARDVRHHRRRADLVAVDPGRPAAGRAVRGVDDQVDLAGLDQLHGGRLAVRGPGPRSACARRSRRRRCAAAPRPCPGSRGSRSRGRRAP